MKRHHRINGFKGFDRDLSMGLAHQGWEARQVANGSRIAAIPAFPTARDEGSTEPMGIGPAERASPPHNTPSYVLFFFKVLSKYFSMG